MAKLKFVVWDNIGNTMLGMRAWEQWDSATQERLVTEDPDARSRVVSFDELFADQEIDLVWLYDPVKSQLGFRELFSLNSGILRDATDPATVAATIPIRASRSSHHAVCIGEAPSARNCNR